MQEVEVAAMQHWDCPSFNSCSSAISFVEIAAKVIKDDEECIGHRDYEEEFGFHSDNTKQTEPKGYNNDDFEFAVVNCTDTADQTFSSGNSKPIFPIFNRHIANQEVVVPQEDKISSCSRFALGRLFVKEFSSSTSSSTSSSSSGTDVDLPSYCIWGAKTFTTTPDRTYCPSNKKSKSVGNNNKPESFRIRDLFHRRSNSDLNKTYVSLAKYAQPTRPSSDLKSSNENSMKSILKRNSVKGKEEEDAKRMDRKLSTKKKGSIISTTSAGNEIHNYLRYQSTKEGDKRRSFLPYKQNLMGFFGFNRRLYPFA